ncbi:MAG: VOC family protein [Solirubrobacteraceae bacterium]|nr:VOC family protein [Solirubrobacteraceae bacterium]
MPVPSITPNLWFDSDALEAAELYVSIFPRSRIVDVTHYGPDAPRPEGTVLTVEFELDGTRFVGINGGPDFTFDEAVSFEISCVDQAEVDHYWDALTADGGSESRCGWLKDRFGLSWQVVPRRLVELIQDPDPARARRALQAMYGMRRLDVAELERAADGA